MKNTFTRRLLTAILSLFLLIGSGLPAAAADTAEGPPPKFDKLLYDAGDFALKAFANSVAALMPLNLPRNYVQSPDFYTGMSRFIDKPEGKKQWSLGYAKASLIPNGYFDAKGSYVGKNDVFVGGGIMFAGRKTPTKLLDDQAVRVTALNDGSGRGTVVLASIDGYALSSTDVRRIRARLRSFAKEKNIVSLNVGVLHQHSEIDTLGMNGPLLPALFLNAFGNLTGLYKPYSGKNSAFMENLYVTVAGAVKSAVTDMRPGKLYYGTADAAPYVRDKRPPMVYDKNLHRFRFVPDDGTKETWLVNFSAHCTGLGADGRIVSGDYPYYMEQKIGRRANFQMIQGAQLAITYESSPFWFEGATRLDTIVPYGHKLGELLIGIKKETPVEPILNVRHMEYRMSVDNPLHLLFFRMQMIEATCVQRGAIGPAMDLITETGYMELGKSLAVVFAPGEIDPCLAMGGGLTAKQAWNGKEFKFTPMKEQTRGGRRLLVFGIMNDHSGYYILPNDVQNFVLFGNEEVNAASSEASAQLLKTYGELIKSIK